MGRCHYIVGSGKQLPYERPPLSKAVLLGQRVADQCAINDKDFYRDQGIDIRVDTVTAIDGEQHHVVLSNQNARTPQATDCHRRRAAAIRTVRMARRSARAARYRRFAFDRGRTASEAAYCCDWSRLHQIVDAAFESFSSPKLSVTLTPSAVSSAGPHPYVNQRAKRDTRLVPVSISQNARKCGRPFGDQHRSALSLVFQPRQCGY
jgi:hypothetical protein